MNEMSTSVPTRREYRRELRVLKRRLRPLKRSVACWLGFHDYRHDDPSDRLGLCRYCYSPNVYVVGGGLAHRLQRWQEAVDKAVCDGVIPE